MKNFARNIYYAIRSWVWQCIVRIFIVAAICGTITNDNIWFYYLIFTLIYFGFEKRLKEIHWSLRDAIPYILTVGTCLLMIRLREAGLEYCDIFKDPCYLNILVAPLYSLLFIKTVDLLPKQLPQHRRLYKFINITANIVTIALLCIPLVLIIICITILVFDI